jgi:hypothetical protein
MTNAERIRNKIGGIYLEKVGWPDNLGIALLSYFEGHMERPENDAKDENGNSEWALMKTNEALDLIAEELNVTV